MSVRKKSAKLGLAAVAASGLALTVLAPANADTKPGTTGVARHLHPRHHDRRRGLRHRPVGRRPDVEGLRQQRGHPDRRPGPTSTPAWATPRPARPVSVTTPTAPASPAARTTTGTQAGVKRDEQVVDPGVAAGHALPSGSGDGRTLLRTPSDPLFPDCRLRPLLRPAQHRGPGRRPAGVPVRRGQDRRGHAPRRPGPGLADGPADPQDLQRHLHQLEPGRRQERADPPLHAEGRLEHAERVRVLPGRSGRQHRASGHRQRPRLARGRLPDLAGPGHHHHQRQLEHSARRTSRSTTPR